MTIVSTSSVNTEHIKIMNNDQIKLISLAFISGCSLIAAGFPGEAQGVFVTAAPVFLIWFAIKYRTMNV
jgi:hypothetical protein